MNLKEGARSGKQACFGIYLRIRKKKGGKENKKTDKEKGRRE